MRVFGVMLLLCCLGFFAEAQDGVSTYYLGAGGGMTQSFTDVYSRKANLNPSGQLSLDYNINRFTSVGIELQGGKVAGGIPDTDSDPSTAYFDSRYATAFLNAKVQLGQFMNKTGGGFFSTFKNIYVGTGVGAMGNIHKERAQTENSSGDQTVYAINYKSMDLLIPLLGGINFPVKDFREDVKFIFTLNMQVNVLPFDLMDNAPDINNRPDIYLLGSAGVKIPFGPRRNIFNTNITF